MNKKIFIIMPFWLKGTKGPEFLKQSCCMVARVLEASRQPFAVLGKLTIIAFTVFCAVATFWLGCLWSCFRNR